MFRNSLNCLFINYKTGPSNLLILKLLTPLTNTGTHAMSTDADGEEGPKKWIRANKYVYAPQKPDEERRPAFVNHVKSHIKYSPKNMWYIACLVRGLSVDEAIKQLSFCLKKGAAAAKETILEAQKMAVEEHNVEFKSNLWVSDSFCGKSVVIKGLRRCAKGRTGIIHYRYVNYFVKLEEGKPPKNYYLPEPQTKQELLDAYLERLRTRKIGSSL